MELLYFWPSFNDVTNKWVVRGHKEKMLIYLGKNIRGHFLFTQMKAPQEMKKRIHKGMH